MLYLFHGQNVELSRKDLAQLVQKYPSADVDFLRSGQIDLSYLVPILSTQPMFSEKRLVVLEGKLLLAQEKELVALLEQIPLNNDVAFWFDDLLSSNSSIISFVNSLKGQIKEYRESVKEEIFSFLDAVSTKNYKKSFEELVLLEAAGQDPIYILNMLIWNFRNQLLVKLDAKQASRLHPFVRKKITSANQNYLQNELIEIYNKLLYYEIVAKTSQLPTEILIDSFLADIYDHKTV